MALITAGGSNTTIRHGALAATLRDSDFPAVELNPQTEARLQSALTTFLGRQVFIHIFTRSTLAFAIRTAPLGSVAVPERWWELRVSL